MNICHAGAQRKAISPLKIGEKLPAFDLTVFIENKPYKWKTQNLKGKIVLFDFFGLGCSECFESIPKMYKLQQLYKDQLQIIIVTTDKKEDIENEFKRLSTWDPFFKEMNELSKKLPFVYSDKTMSEIFPYDGLPMHTWIDVNQKFLVSTYASSTKKENIDLLINGQQPKFHPFILTDFKRVGFDYNSWLAKRFINLKKAKSFSIILPKDSNSVYEIRQLINAPGSKRPIEGYFINYSLHELYKFAYYGSTTNAFKFPLVSLEVKNKDPFVHPSYKSLDYYQWCLDNSYCYLARMSASDSLVFFPKMRRDIDDAFDLKSEMATRPVKCFVLRKIDSQVDKLVSKGGESLSKYVYQDGESPGERIIRNHQFYLLLEHLTDQFFAPFEGNPQLSSFIDETNIDKKLRVDFNLPSFQNIYDPSNLSVLKKALETYGLTLTEETRTLEVLVIKDNK